MDKQKMLHEIMALDFAITDLKLYLDTHSEDMQAIDLYNNCVQKAKLLRENYQTMYGPIIAEMYQYSTDRWDWVKDPWPWDREANRMEVD